MASTALITGGASGIGRAAANKLAQVGIRVLVVGRNADRRPSSQRIRNGAWIEPLPPALNNEIDSVPGLAGAAAPLILASRHPVLHTTEPEQATH